MELLRTLEKRILGWATQVPHLPVNAQKWLGLNIWWIVLIGVIITAIATLFTFFGTLGLLAVASDISSQYYVTGNSVVVWAAIVGFVSLFFSIFWLILSASAVGPLKRGEKKGWVILFAGWLIYVLSIVVNAVLTLNPFSFILTLIFGAIFAAISGYFLFELHGQFDHKKATAEKATIVEKTE